MSNGTKAGDFELIARMWPYVRPFRRWLVLVAVMTPIGVLGGIIQPLIVKTAIDEHLSVGEFSGLPTLAAVFMAVVLCGFSARALGMWGLQVAGLRAIASVRRKVFAHVVAQGQKFFDTRTTGSLLTRSTTDVEALYESLAFGAVGLLIDGLTIVGTLAAMLLLDWKMTVVTFAFAPVIVVVVDVFRRRLRILSTTIRETLSHLNGYFAEHIFGMSVIQLYGAEDLAAERFKSLSYKYLDAFRRSNWWDAGLYAIMDGLSALAIGAMLWYGASAFGADTAGISLGLLVAFIDYLDKIFVPIREFSGRIATIQRAVAALERIFDLLDTDARVVDGHEPQTRARGDVAFEDVRFAYGPDRPTVLHGVGFDVSPGEVVAIVGATGSGKTTLGKLLTRMYDGYEGAIRLDGREIRELRLGDLRDQITVVHQDAHLFDGTVRENIALWSPHVSDERVREAATLARAHSFVDTFTDGYDHRITERGANLSAGQRQLLAIARAMARDAPVVILDEATSSVDSMTEKLIDEAIEALFAQRTVIVIAHRLSTIVKADRIVVLHRGRIVEQGSHDELMDRGDRYKLLVETGFAL